MTIYDHSDYKTYLNSLASTEPRGFKKRLAEVSRCQTAYISHVLNSHAHFNWAQAEAIATELAHSPEEKEYFLLLLEFTKAHTPPLKKFLREKLDKLRDHYLTVKERVKVKDSLSKEDQARYYSVWYYAAIHVMLTIPAMQTKDALAQALKLRPKLVLEVLEYLCAIGLATKNGARYHSFKWIFLEKTSPLISKHHTNWRIQAINSLHSPSDDDLHFSSVFTITEKDLQKIRSMLVKEIEDVVAIVKEAKEETTMAMALDFFRV